MLGPVLDPTLNPGFDCALEPVVYPVLNPVVDQMESKVMKSETSDWKTTVEFGRTELSLKLAGGGV